VRMKAVSTLHNHLSVLRSPKKDQICRNRFGDSFGMPWDYISLCEADNHVGPARSGCAGCGRGSESKDRRCRRAATCPQPPQQYAILLILGTLKGYYLVGSLLLLGPFSPAASAVKVARTASATASRSGCRKRARRSARWPRWSGITVGVAERHYAPYVRELQERGRGSSVVGGNCHSAAHRFELEAGV
jgi:hypothetical protein